MHILPALGQTHVDQLHSDAISELVSRMLAKGYATGTTNRVVIVLRRMFNLARSWRIPGVSENPTVGIKIAPDVHRERFLAEDELDRLLAAIEQDENKPAGVAILLLLLTGARRNEITHAQWDHVDWATKTLLVPRSKSGKSRAIALNSEATELLRSVSPVQENPYIFPSPTTGRPSPSLYFPWRRIRARAGLTDLRLHDLRHSFASFLANRDVSLYRIQVLLGHSSSRYTQRYAHLAPQKVMDAAEIVAGIVRSRKTDAPS
jgi:integrase